MGLNFALRLPSKIGLDTRIACMYGVDAFRLPAIITKTQLNIILEVQIVIDRPQIVAAIFQAFEHGKFNRGISHAVKPDDWYRSSKPEIGAGVLIEIKI